mmetsp:Transcript_31569/g.63532  ORF Transcript_31569/g.63532 Transcript_31569/m.63532 type:complete len:82 (+) Transcript_31569:3-248(+)
MRDSALFNLQGIVRHAVYATAVGLCYFLGIGFGGGLTDGLQGISVEVAQQRGVRRAAEAQRMGMALAVACFVGFRVSASRS